LDIYDYILQEETSVFDAAAAINANGRQIVFICCGTRLTAALSDGDIRRYILQNGDFSRPVREVANRSVRYLTVSSAADAEVLMEESDINAVPIVNEEKEIVSIRFRYHGSVRKNVRLDVPVVIMAGGKGERLIPYTGVLPKPLMPIGEKTVTERIIDRFADFGCTDFRMIVNYKKELIKAYFSETPCRGNMRFIDEQKYLGTGGGLALLKGTLDSTFFMTNCDILIEADYEDLLKYHRSMRNVVTMVCAMKRIKVPYGAVTLNDGGKPASLLEKPEYPLLTNTGLYVIEPVLTDMISTGEFVHTTDLIQRLIDRGENVGVYPVSENAWLDIGQPEELKAAHAAWL
jgi:dTDP-glucose pyrophosphorylase